MKLNQGNSEVLSSWQEQEERFSSNVLGHLPDKLGDEDPWKQMKWVGKPACCKVKGRLIESLENTYNFRRGFSLKYVKDSEDRTHILPWLLRSDINLNLRKQTEYLDLGTNSFRTSIEWFVVMCHCDLTEIRAFKVHDQLLDFPEEEGNEESKNYAPDNDKALRVKERFGIPQWMLKPMRFHYNCVADGDEYSSN
ncbi:unnamed protein product [Sphagnum balticum]